MRSKLIAAGGLVTVSLLGMTALTATTAHAAPAPAPTTGGTTCLPGDAPDAWPSWADGRPGRDPGVRVWHDSAGWHVRVTHNTIHDRVFAGQIETTGELLDVHAVRLEPGDQLRVGAAKHVIVFRFHNYGGIDGFDFTTHCAPSLGFGFLSDAHKVPTSRIAIGAGYRHPANNPFLIKRI